MSLEISSTDSAQTFSEETLDTEAGHPTAATNLPVVRQSCCGMAGHRMMKVGFGVLSLALVVSIAVAAYFAGQRDRLAQSTALTGYEIEGGDFSGIQLPAVEALTAVTSEKYSIATGGVSEDADGFFVLDHNSGLLQCTVIYPRMAQFMAKLQANVADALGTGGKGGTYMMVTGRADFPRASNRPAASTVIYVIDTATGNFACYGIPFDRVSANANRPQANALVLITTGSANPVIDRDNLR